MTPQQEHWKRVWRQAQANMPDRIYKTVSSTVNLAGSSLALARCLGMKLKDPKGRYSAAQHIYTNTERGSRPKDPEVRRKLELCAGPYGKLLAWQKLKELGLAEKYQKP